LELLSILLIAAGLSADAAAVALSAGASNFASDLRSAVRLTFHLGLFQFLMPVLGWYAGMQVEIYIRSFDHWIAFALLSYVGAKMCYSAVTNDRAEMKVNITKGAPMVLVSVATSIDALAVGLSLAFLKVEIIAPSLIIGTVTFLISFTAYLLGGKLKHKLGRGVELAGGLVLLGIGIKILLEHL
jgi:putative Mn2+ efflux pump MntP